MPNTINLKKLAMGSLAVAALAASQGAIAHTRLETPTVVEGARVRNYEVIAHGCNLPSTGGKNAPSYGTSVVFPNAVNYVPIIGVNSNNTGATAGWQYATYTTNPASTYYSPLAGIVTWIRGGGAWQSDQNAFQAGQNKVDANGNKDGFWAGGSYFDQSITTSVDTPFYVQAVTIAPTSCARSITFMLAIADVCNINSVSTTATDNDVLYWSPIPNFIGVPGAPFGTPAGSTTNTNVSPSGVPVGKPYSNYDGYTDAAHTLPGDGWGSPASLKVTRNLTTNPLPAGCNGNGGLGDDIFVFPSAHQINTEIPVYSGANQTGTLYWQ